MSRPKRGTRGTHSTRPAWESDPNERPAGAGQITCVHCGRSFPDQAHGTGQRNHCPHCLWSVHVDIKPGDRASLCVKPMEPIALWVSDGGEWRVIHRCSGCGVLKPNRLAGDDSETVIAELVGRLTER